MWFLKGKPTSITVNALIQSVPFGYQATNYRFKVSAQQDSGIDGKIWVGIPFPWAPHKPDGSFKINTENLLSTIDPTDENVTILTRQDVGLHIRPRDFKKLDTVDLVHIQELCQWYLEDIGIISVWIKPDEWYQVNFTHKIASDSCLFLPSRLPTIVNSYAPSMDYKLWVLNAWNVETPKYLKEESHNHSKDFTDLKCYKIADWEWNDDTRIHTENWESSDDASSDDD